LEATLKRELGIDAELIQGRGGVFDVVANGKLVYSKHATGRFPEEEEVVEAIRPLM
jgi:selT/selW/selH-like putative selenoprotein